MCFIRCNFYATYISNLLIIEYHPTPWILPSRAILFIYTSRVTVQKAFKKTVLSHRSCKQQITRLPQHHNYSPRQTFPKTRMASPFTRSLCLPPLHVSRNTCFFEVTPTTPVSRKRRQDGRLHQDFSINQQIPSPSCPRNKIVYLIVEDGIIHDFTLFQAIRQSPLHRWISP